jgi:hypothetical protein
MQAIAISTLQVGSQLMVIDPEFVTASNIASAEYAPHAPPKHAISSALHFGSELHCECVLLRFPAIFPHL